jgi:hypothetical protein
LFYALSGNNGSNYVLNKDGGTSYPTETSYAGGAGNTEVNFDITINKHTIFSGIVCLDVTHSTGFGTVGGQVTFRLIKYSGSESALLTLTTTSLGAGTTVSNKLIGTISRVVFKRGDVLRLEAVIAGAGGTTTLIHNPNVAGNELKLWLPVVNLE